jgi:chromosomal replication initiator protein
VSNPESPQQTISIGLIQRSVADAYHLRLADITNNRRPANIALPRNVAIYLCHQLTTASLHEIWRAFDVCDYAMVPQIHRIIEVMMREDKELSRIVASLTQKLVASSA